MPDAKRSGLGELIWWPQDTLREWRELGRLSAGKTSETLRDIWLDLYVTHMCHRGMLGQVLVVIISPLLGVLWFATRNPNIKWAFYAALVGGIATFAKALYDHGKTDDPDFDPPNPVPLWDMNDWKEGLWVVLVVGGLSLLGLVIHLLTPVFWFLTPLLPEKWREGSKVYGDTLDPEQEKIRALFAGVTFLAILVFLVCATYFGLTRCWIGVGLAAGLFLFITGAQRSAMAEKQEETAAWHGTTL